MTSSRYCCQRGSFGSPVCSSRSLGRMGMSGFPSLSFCSFVTVPSASLPVYFSPRSGGVLLFVCVCSAGGGPFGMHLPRSLPPLLPPFLPFLPLWEQPVTVPWCACAWPVSGCLRCAHRLPCAPAVDVAGGAAEGAAGRRVRRVGGSRAGAHQALRPAAADHAAGDRQRDQGRGRPHPAAEVGPPLPVRHRCPRPAKGFLLLYVLNN